MAVTVEFGRHASRAIPVYLGGGIEVSNEVVGGGTRSPAHVHTAPSFGIGLSGGASFRFGNRYEMRASEHSAWYLPPGDGHSDVVAAKEWHIVQIEVDQSSGWRLDELGREFRDPFVLEDPAIRTKAWRLASELRGPDAAAACHIEGLTADLLSTLSKFRDDVQLAKPKWFRAVLDLLHARFADSMTLAEIAAEVSVHPVYLARTFRRFENQTVGDYIWRLRVRASLARLRSSAGTLADIACEMGFYDESHFSHAFREALGITPGAYRAQFQQ